MESKVKKILDQIYKPTLALFSAVKQLEIFRTRHPPRRVWITKNEKADK